MNQRLHRAVVLMWHALMAAAATLGPRAGAGPASSGTGAGLMAGHVGMGEAVAALLAGTQVRVVVVARNG